MADRMVSKNLFFKIVEDQFGWIVVVGLNFINDDHDFFFNFFLREGRVKRNIENEFHGPVEVLIQDDGIDHRFFFRCVSV